MAETKGVLPSDAVNTLGNATKKWENIYAVNLSDGTTTKSMTDVLAGGGGGGDSLFEKDTTENAVMPISDDEITAIVPSDKAKALGTATKHWDKVYVNEIYENGMLLNAANKDLSNLSEAGNKKFMPLLPTGAYVTETQVNDDGSWYRVYSDGWIEQGLISIGTADVDVTLTWLKPFKDTNYYTSRTPISNSTAYSFAYARISIGTQTPTTVTIRVQGAEPGRNNRLFACGMGAE